MKSIGKQDSAVSQLHLVEFAIRINRENISESREYHSGNRDRSAKGAIGLLSQSSNALLVSVRAATGTLVKVCGVIVAADTVSSRGDGRRPILELFEGLTYRPIVS